MTRAHAEAGYSLVEILVSIMIFFLVSFGFLSVMVSGTRSSNTTRDNVRVAEEARLGLNRIVRDTREAGWIQLAGASPTATHNSFTVKIDYNGDGAYANPSGAVAPAEGNYEVVTYAYDAAAKAITLTADGFPTETIVKGADCVRDPATNVCTSDVFSFSSNRLEYDWDGNGVVTLAELNQSACPPNNVTAMDVCNTTLVDLELANITNVNLALSVTAGAKTTGFFAEAQLRNRR